MPTDAIILLALVGACATWSVGSIVWSNVREVRPGTKRYRTLIRELREWRVLEAHDPTDTERVRELAQNWIRLSRNAPAVVLMVILLLVGAVLYFCFTLLSRIPDPPVIIWMLICPAMLVIYVCSSQATFTSLSRAQLSTQVARELPPYRLRTDRDRPIMLGLVSTAVFGALTLGTLFGLIPHSFDTPSWTLVRTHPLLVLIFPVTAIVLIASCEGFVRRLTRLRPLLLSQDSVLSVRASCALMQQEINRLHSGLAYLVVWMCLGQVTMLPDYGNFSILLFVIAFLVLLVALGQSARSGLMSLPPPEPFMLPNDAFGRTEGPV